MNTKNGDTAYWRYQVLFWIGYSAISVSFAVHYEGWTPRHPGRYLLYPFYSIGLTHLLHLDSGAGAAFASHLAKDRAVGPGDPGRGSGADVPYRRGRSGDGGQESMFYDHHVLLSVAFGTTSAVGMWVFIHEFREHREQRTQLQLALREAELSALEAQINPHFLFNCLNSIRALVAENPARAQDMITRLANIFRYNLQREPAHTVPLASEVEVVGDYLALESVRFRGSLARQVRDLARAPENAGSLDAAASSGGERVEAWHRTASLPAGTL